MATLYLRVSPIILDEYTGLGETRGRQAARAGSHPGSDKSNFKASSCDMDSQYD